MRFFAMHRIYRHPDDAISFRDVWAISDGELNEKLPGSLSDAEQQVILVAAYNRLCRARMQPWAHADADPVRREIDDAVAEAYGISAGVLADWRERLAKEPTVANRSPL